MVPRAHEIRPRKIGDSIECWIRPVRVKDGAHSDFWRASSDVYLFLLRGYDEDSQITGATPGTVIDFILPVWRIGECVLHVERLAMELNARARNGCNEKKPTKPKDYMINLSQPMT